MTKRKEEADRDRGRVFVIPLLGGGYAYGVVTSGYKFGFSNIYDRVGDSMTVPDDLAGGGFCLYDVQGLDTGMQRKNFERVGPSWVWSDVVHEGARPEQRYVVVGKGPVPPPKRLDILGEEEPVHLSPDETHDFPTVEYTGAPFNTARIEVAVKRLGMTPKELIVKWRAGEHGDRDAVFKATSKIPKGYSRR